MAQPPAGSDARWAALRRFTPARIGLPRTGPALTTGEQLRFLLAHAEARDAVHEPLDPSPLLEALSVRRLASLLLHSSAMDRRRFLARPDLGRQLDLPSRQRLEGQPVGHDLLVVLADGLSARALQRHAVPLLDLVLPELGRRAWRVGPLAVVEQGRVAVGDEIGALLQARMVAVLIGERPGLSAPDSLGVYLTWAPAPGRSDAERNCISNIRPEGLDYPAAAARLLYLLSEARRRQLTGVMLKDEADRLPPPGPRSA